VCRRNSKVGENLLSLLRDGRPVLTNQRATALLSLGDAVRSMLRTVEETATEGDHDYTALVATLQRLQEPDAAEEAAEPAPAEDSEPVAEPADTEHVVEQPAAELTDGGEAADASGDGKRSVSESTIRVDVGLLDSLMNLVGELVLARNQILQYTNTADAGLAGASQHLNLITTELQERVMKTRLQQIGTIWSKFPRVVRDLALTFGKEVRIEMEGRETELDGTIVIQGKVTELVDLPALSEALAARLFSHSQFDIDPALVAVGAGA
jgi:two-component system chemotaxis sensor kinase CheA